MTPTNAPSAEQISAWLAAQPCPHLAATAQLEGVFEQEFLDPFIDKEKGRAAVAYDCPWSCKGSSLAFKWASEPCSDGQGCLACVPDPKGETYEALIHTRGRICDGSGRVPKDVGLSLIIVESQYMGCHAAVSEAVAKQVLEKWSTEAEITLAALRAIAAQAGMPQGKDA